MPCVFANGGIPQQPAVVVANGTTSVRVDAALLDWGDTESTGASNNSEEEPNTELRIGGEPQPGKWQLRTLLVYAYERAKLNCWPKQGPNRFRCDMIDLLHALSDIHVLNKSRPRGATNYGTITVTPELTSRPEATIQRMLDKGSRPIVIAKFESVTALDEGRNVQVNLQLIHGMRFIVSSRHWSELVKAYRNPELYLRENFSTVMIFTAGRADECGPGTIRMKNLGWIHVTEHNIPIESREEGWEIRQLADGGFSLEKVLTITRDCETGLELPRRDVNVKNTALGEIEIEIFGMLLGSYIHDIPKRSLERGQPLLCIRYENGQLVSRYWANPALEAKYPGGALSHD